MLLTILSVMVLAFTGYTVDIAIGSPPPKVPKGQQAKHIDVPGFIVFIRLGARAMKLLAYATTFCETITCVSRFIGSNETNAPIPGTSIILRICPPLRTSKITLYPNAYLPSLACLGCLILITGSILRTWSQRTLEHQFTWEVTILPDHKLVTHGPYSIVRHPAYTGTLLVILGEIIFAVSRGTYFSECLGLTFPQTFLYGKAFTLTGMTVGVLTMLRRSVKEDELLKQEFGKEWEQWSRKTRFRIFPWIF